MWLLLIYPLILGLQWWAWGEVLPLTPLNPAVLLMVVMVMVSLFVTPDILGSLGKLAGVLLGILVFFTVSRHSKTRLGWQKTFGLFAIAGMGIASLGLLVTSWLPSNSTALSTLFAKLPIKLISLPGAENGVNVNELAGALVWVVPVVLLAGVALITDPKWFASRSGRGKIRGKVLVFWSILLFVALLVCAGVLILSQSRDGYLAMAFALPFLFVLVIRGKLRYWLIGIGVVFLIAGAIVISHGGTQLVLNRLLGYLPAQGVEFSINSMYGRIEIWSRAVRAIKESPLAGLGMNVFRKAVYLQSPPFQDTGFDIAHAHDELLQAALDLGLPGLVGFLALYIGAVGMLAKPIRGSGAWRLLSIGLLGGLLAHFLFGITDAVALGAKPGFLFWWLLGLVCGIYQLNQPAKVAQP